MFWPCVADFKYRTRRRLPGRVHRRLPVQRRHPKLGAGGDRAAAPAQEPDAGRLRRLRDGRRHPGARQPEVARGDLRRRLPQQPDAAQPGRSTEPRRATGPRRTATSSSRASTRRCSACPTSSRWTTRSRAARRRRRRSGRCCRRSLAGEVPARADAVRVGCDDQSVCDECHREKRKTRVEGVQAPAPGDPRAQLVPARAGLRLPGRRDAQRLRRAVHQGRTCRAAAATARRAWRATRARRCSARSARSSTRRPRSAPREIVDQIADPTGTFYRFSLASSDAEGAPVKRARSAR